MLKGQPISCGGGGLITTRSNPRGKKWEKMEWPSKGVLPLVIRTLFSFKSFQFFVFCCHAYFIFHNTTFTFTPVIGTLCLNLFLVSLSLFILHLVMISPTFSFCSFPFHPGVFKYTKLLISFFCYDCPEKRWKLWKYSCETVATYQMDRTIFVIGRLSFDKP